MDKYMEVRISLKISLICWLCEPVNFLSQSKINFVSLSLTYFFSWTEIVAQKFGFVNESTELTDKCKLTIVQGF